MPPAKRVKAKKKCCASAPRCKRCPVVCRRLELAGLATREGKRTWKVDAIRKKQLKAARAS